MNLQKTILIIDDDARMRDLLRRQLRSENYSVLEANDGEAALRMLGQRKKIHLILLDILMPLASGLDIFDQIRKSFPDIPVIVTSVYSREEQEFLVWDADGYYYKSDSLSGLMQEVEKVFKAEYSVHKRGGV
jgi:CheY-like chemotaxis protein